MGSSRCLVPDLMAFASSLTVTPWAHLTSDSVIGIKLTHKTSRITTCPGVPRTSPDVDRFLSPAPQEPLSVLGTPGLLVTCLRFLFLTATRSLPLVSLLSPRYLPDEI